MLLWLLLVTRFASGLAPNIQEIVIYNAFESGDTAAWSGVGP